MKKSLSLVPALGGLTALLVVGVMAWEAEAGSPTEQLKHSVDKAIKVLQDPALQADAHLAERQAAIREIANETFDFVETAKRSLARHWRERTKREQEEFVQLFADLWDRSDFFKIDQYGGEQLFYLDETLEGDRATVQTKIITQQGTEVPVDFLPPGLASSSLARQPRHEAKFNTGKAIRGDEGDGRVSAAPAGV